MSRLTLILAGAAAVGAIAAGIALAGPERINYPEKFQQDFVMFNTVDRPDLKAVRLVFINKAADAAAKSGQPLPRAASSSSSSGEPSSTTKATSRATPRAASSRRTR